MSMPFFADLKSGARKRKIIIQATLMCGLMVGGCTKESDQAQAEYEMAKRAGAGDTELCARARKVAEAYLKEGNEHEYVLADIEAGGPCMDARLKGFDDQF